MNTPCMNTPISFFQTPYSTQAQTYPLDWFLSQVQHGTWRHLVEPFRRYPSDSRASLLPVVGLSGVLKPTRKGLTLAQPSGIVCLELRGFLYLTQARQTLSRDRYTHAVFANAAADALCVIVRTNGRNPEEAFDRIERYYEGRYGWIADPAGRQPTCLHRVSVDEGLGWNPHAERFVC